MFCSKCGAEIDDQSRFCKGCGSPVAAGQSAPERPIVDKAEVASWLSEPNRVTRLGAAIALFSLAFLPQVSCMGTGLTGLNLLGHANELGGRGLLLALLLLAAFGCAIAALFLPRAVLGVGGGVAQLLIMAGVTEPGLSLAFGSFVSLLGFLGVALSSRLAALAARNAPVAAARPDAPREGRPGGGG